MGTNYQTPSTVIIANQITKELNLDSKEQSSKLAYERIKEKKKI